MTLFSAYRKTLWAPGAGTQVIGGFGDYAEIFEDVIENEPADAELDAIAVKLANALPGEIEEYEVNTEDEFLELAGAALKDTPAAEAENCLSLAIVSFACTKCKSVGLRWPAVTRHACLVMLPPYTDDEAARYQNELAIFLRGPRCRRNADGVSSIAEGVVTAATSVTVAREVVAICGLDPDSATHSDMEACTVRLRCCLCAGLAKQEVFDWWGAVSFCNTHHSASRRLTSGCALSRFNTT